MSIYRYVTLLTNQLRFPYTIIYETALLIKGNFDVLMTVHLSIILVIDQLNAQILVL